MADFNGRVAIVTGAGAGLGRAHALALAAAGARVVVNDISAGAAAAVAAEITAAGGQALAAACDVSDMAAVQAVVDQTVAAWGGVQILVNNAGILRDKSFIKLEPADFALVMQVHVTGSYNFTRAVWPLMREAGYGRILLTSSSSGVYGNFGQANYGAAKAAMIGLMNVLHIEGEKYDIRVNTLTPTAATGMTEGLLPPEEAALLAPETVSPAVLYLVSEAAPSRLIMGAGAGVFAVIRIEESRGAWLPEAERTPEGIARHFAEIADFSAPETPETAFGQTSKFTRIATAAKG